MSEAKQSDSTNLLGPLPEAAHHSNGPFGLSVVPLYTAEQMHAFRAEGVAAERERIKSLVCRLTLQAETCDGDGPEVDTSRKALACTILAAINGYEPPAPAATQSDLFAV